MLFPGGFLKHIVVEIISINYISMQMIARRLLNICQVAIITFGLLACATPSVDKQLTDAFARDTISADAGNPLAAFDVGIVYYLGYSRGRTPDGFIHFKPMEQNNALAYKYLKISADNGNAEAAALIGGLLMSGNGVPKDEKEAVKYFEQSKNQFVESKYSLGLYYLNTSDKSLQQKGYDLVSNAVKTGNSEMIKVLALYYAKGVCVKKDAARASELNQQAETIRLQNIEKLKARMAAIEDSQARQKKYGQTVDDEIAVKSVSLRL